MRELANQIRAINQVEECELKPPNPRDPIFHGKPTINFRLNAGKRRLLEEEIREIGRKLNFKSFGTFSLGEGKKGASVLSNRPEVKGSLHLTLIPKDLPEGAWTTIDFKDTHEVENIWRPQIEIKGDEELPPEVRDRIVNLIRALRPRKAKKE